MKLSHVILFCLIPLLSVAQLQVERMVFSPLGISAEGALKVDGTLGETFIGQFENNELGLSVGFHQTDLMMTAISYPTTGMIDIYPNPSTDWISLKGAAARYQVEIMDINGLLLRTHSSVIPSQKIDLSGIHPGIYFIKIMEINQQTIQVEKIVKTE